MEVWAKKVKDANQNIALSGKYSGEETIFNRGFEGQVVFQHVQVVGISILERGKGTNISALVYTRVSQSLSSFSVSKTLCRISIVYYLNVSISIVYYLNWILLLK